MTKLMIILIYDNGDYKKTKYNTHYMIKILICFNVMIYKNLKQNYTRMQVSTKFPALQCYLP